MNKKVILLLLFVITALQYSEARVYLGAPFGDGMVLQRETKANLWGKAEPGSTVTLVASWNYKEYYTKADNNGKWSIAIPTPKASFSPYSITLNDGTTPLVVRNVLIGEVWFASGQSNMEMPLSGWDKCPITNSAAVLAATAKYSGKLHYAYVKPSMSREPLDSIGIVWRNSTPDEMKIFSAVAYYFATALIDKLQVPVGIIFSSYGGSNVEAWIPRNVVETYSDVNLNDSIFKKMDQHVPTVLYNAMLKPFIGYTLKGFIWYQGESNVGYCRDSYAKHFTDMIATWRKEWKQGNLPFYYVEIAPYKYNGPNNTQAAFLRYQQFKAQHMAKKIGMVGTNDCVTAKENTQIHPANKQPIGLRLANWALANDYKQDNINYKHPTFKSLSIKGHRAYLSFSNVHNGYNLQQGIQGFEVCGSDSVFKPAKAVVKEEKIMVSSSEVDVPVAVRYCFKNFQKGNLANKEGLPVIPFRTDSFEK